MTLVRWDPFRDLVNVHGGLGRLFRGLEGPEVGYGAWAPPVDIFERGDDLVIRAELPGVTREEIDIRAENGRLVLKGERKRSAEARDQNTYREERVYGSFTRSFSLPTTVDTARIAASYKDGVLEVVLPKAEEAKPKKIAIQAA